MFLTRHISKILGWFDSSQVSKVDMNGNDVDWLRVIPFILMHLCCLFVLTVGWSPIALVVSLTSYLVRMFAITAFYHRYFSHKAFNTSRFCQFLFALLGATASQRGPIWWASHHRRHHLYSDQEKDTHSPRHGFLWSHIGWFLCLKNFSTREHYVRDLLKYPELRWLDRYDSVVPIVYGFMMFGLGKWLEVYYPELQTSAAQMLIWGYFISSVVLIHCTLFVNSLAHIFGSRRYQTNDDSRNNGFLALITLDEGWHNNHHHYSVSVRQGFFWWEIDISYYLLVIMSWFGLIWDLKKVPVERLTSNRISPGMQR